MKAVWSLWTKPLLRKKSLNWNTKLQYLLSWVLSVETAKPHFSETALYTDDIGAKILIEDLGLKFDHVYIDLNVLSRYDPEWWAVGKIYTYLLQTEPFVHIDYDVFMWKPLPVRILHAPILAQNPEYFDISGSWYYPQKFDLIRRFNGWIPEEVEWYKSSGHTQKAMCCGIFGGNRVDFIKYYAEQAIETLLEPKNQTIWRFLGGDNILVEQYLLAACIEYHQGRKSSPFNDISVECLFNSSEDAFNPQTATELGYTHLIGGAKKSDYSCMRLEKRMQEKYPEYFERCKSVSLERAI
jgi:hypothetical protein